MSANRGPERHVADVVEEEVESTLLASVLAQSNRRDRWTVAASTSMFTLLARSFIDFRQAETIGKTVEIAVTCVFGRVTLVVPVPVDETAVAAPPPADAGDYVVPREPVGSAA